MKKYILFILIASSFAIVAQADQLPTSTLGLKAKSAYDAIMSPGISLYNAGDVVVEGGPSYTTGPSLPLASNNRPGTYGYEASIQYWHTRFIGYGTTIGAKSFGGDLPVDHLDAIALARFPFAESHIILRHLSPFAETGLGTAFDTGDKETLIGFGLTWRFTPKLGVDGSYVYRFKTHPEDNNGTITAALTFVF